jgi:hypothetical protein
MLWHTPFVFVKRQRGGTFEKSSPTPPQNLSKNYLQNLLRFSSDRTNSNVHMGPLPHMLDADICFALERVAKEVTPTEVYFSSRRKPLCFRRPF